jgi:hypothetical protein
MVTFAKLLRDAVRRVIPDVNFDERRLFREFVRAVGRKCSTWETVNDSFVEKNRQKVAERMSDACLGTVSTTLTIRLS